MEYWPRAPCPICSTEVKLGGKSMDKTSVCMIGMAVPNVEKNIASDVVFYDATFVCFSKKTMY
ncbi:hypothetical protein Pcaca03_41440 [Pectobacterium carotovorum subsp. carotovorum]|uniref:Uncharacterized protein n=1 Tax=Pectobacterium carotovorum subsp. carotovorum TaxID=555 RepID=A0AAI9L5B9_PECCC|nr:hypothetical protein SOASR016_41620 [Pectobacterium carotovorum subsp. carotovorum]GLV71700.1 hypothetical protein Pcaca03_41440 [Pectobacterium carotovorum subsp. carotovorum]